MAASQLTLFQEPSQPNKPICSFPGCKYPRRGLKDLCDSHYAQLRRKGVLSPLDLDAWTNAELWILRNAYDDAGTGQVHLDKLEKTLGRKRSSICRKARELGLTDVYRKWAKSRRKYATDAELRAAISERTKALWKERGHPRGMLGKKHTPEVKKRIGENSTKWRANLTPKKKRAIYKKGVATRVAKYGSNLPACLRSARMYSRTKGGKREDLGGRYFRSAWEANYARYLRFLVEQNKIKSWEFEVKTFVFHGVTRNPLSYTPDFKVTNLDDSCEWHEVKGWMDSKSRSKLKRMAKFYPEEKVVVIGEKDYLAIARTACKLIKGWEGKR